MKLQQKEYYSAAKDDLHTENKKRDSDLGMDFKCFNFIHDRAIQTVKTCAEV